MPQDPAKEFVRNLTKTPPAVEKVQKAVRPVAEGIRKKVEEGKEAAKRLIEKVRPSRKPTARASGR